MAWSWISIFRLSEITNISLFELPLARASLYRSQLWSVDHEEEESADPRYGADAHTPRLRRLGDMGISSSPKSPMSSRASSASLYRSLLDNEKQNTLDAQDTVRPWKRMRITFEDPCSLIVPLALKQYGIEDDSSQYSMWIVVGDDERCLGMDEKPLILSRRLSNIGKKFVFILRRHSAPTANVRDCKLNLFNGYSDSSAGQLYRRRYDRPQTYHDWTPTTSNVWP